MEKFAKTFWTLATSIKAVDGRELDGKDLIGKPFIVIDEVDKNSYDYEEVGALYIVELDGGILIQAFPEEVENEGQIASGRYPELITGENPIIK
jgi:hypothetical protein